MVYGQHEARAPSRTPVARFGRRAKKKGPVAGAFKGLGTICESHSDCGVRQSSDNHLWYRLLDFKGHRRRAGERRYLTVMFCDLVGSMRRYGGPLARRFEPQLVQLPDQRATVMLAAATAPITLQGQD